MKIVILFCGIVLLAWSCKKADENPVSKNASDVFPNKIGDLWLYHVSDTVLTLQTVDSIRQYDMTVSVVDSATLPGGIKANVWVYNSPNEKDTNYVFQNADTVNFAAIIGTEMVVIRRYILPLHLHQSWMYNNSSINNFTIDSEEDIMSGQNQFHTFHLSGSAGLPDAMVYIEEWIANNVGLVKRYSNNSGSLILIKHHTLWSLVSYHLN
jgi:hypothetical protein